MIKSAVTPSNLLPRDGTVLYFPEVIPVEKALDYFEKLLCSVRWSHDEVVIFGKKHVTKREVAWYGDDSFKYSYSNTTKVAHPWTDELMELKHITEAISRQRFNSCLLNLYHNGEEGMGYHSDDEKELGVNPVIASVSLGAERKFTFKHRQTRETCSVMLGNGSILLMKDETQHHWLHTLPKMKRVSSQRINLTFRSIKS
jgi:alkylated DNA repair dioxygenase AlkB